MSLLGPQSRVFAAHTFAFASRGTNSAHNRDREPKEGPSHSNSDVCVDIKMAKQTNAARAAQAKHMLEQYFLYVVDSPMRTASKSKITSERTLFRAENPLAAPMKWKGAPRVGDDLIKVSHLGRK